jgi:Trk K+ transport system NAD-binding subunit
MAAYRTALAGNVRQVRSAGPNGMLIETELVEGSVVAGRTVAATPWPRDTVLVSVERGDQLIVPRGDLTLIVGDRLTVFSTPTGRPKLEALFSAVGEDVPAHE